MLMQLGSVVFEVAPLNANEVEHTVSASFAQHPVLGVRPDLEFTGAGPEPWRIHGKIFPQRFGGLADLEMLQALCRGGQAQFLMRGDGTPLGWVVIDRVNERATYLDGGGVGRVIVFEVTVRKARGPSADGIFNALLSLFQ